jgi:hypothetical protein
MGTIETMYVSYRVLAGCCFEMGSAESYTTHLSKQALKRLDASKRY